MPDDTAPSGEAEAELIATDDTAPETGTETETTETEAEAKKPDPDDKADPAAKRIGRLTARLAAKDAAIQAMEARLAEIERRAGPKEPDRPLTQDELPKVIEARVAEELAKREVATKVASFHEAGKAAYPDWQDRCAALMEMGADPAFAELLIDMPDGAKLAASLADDPDELERIAGLKTERARAIALGKYSAALEAKPAVAKPVSKAPPPIKPITGAVKTVFNEATATADQLVAHYAKQAMAKRGL